MKLFRVTTFFILFVFIFTACSNPPKPNGLDSYTEIGESERTLKLAALDGYVQDGSSDIKNDWVSDFEDSSKCNVEIEVVDSEVDLIETLENSKVDGVLGRTNVIGEMISKDLVSPINTDLIGGYVQVPQRLKGQPFNTAENQTLSIPVSFGFDVFNHRIENKIENPNSWESFFAPKDKNDKIASTTKIENFGIAALYLKSKNKKLNIKNPFALSQSQFDAVVQLLKNQKEKEIDYIEDSLEIEDKYISESADVGATELSLSYSVRSKNAPYNFSIPDEGTIGWVDAWAISKKTQSPNCMYKWLNHVISSPINAKYAQYIGAAPANLESCSFTTKTNHCKLFYATDEKVLNRVTFWTNPSKACLTGTTDFECKTYDDYKSAWEKITGQS